MEKFTVLTGIATPLRMSNVDTDQIIPGEYLKRISRHGYEDALFAGWRTDPDFVLNQPQYAGSPILVAGPDFGTGSSREHAVWAIMDYGFDVVISSRFADIFRNNCTKNGLVPVTVPVAIAEQLLAAVEADPSLEITVDMERLLLEVPALGISQPFPFDAATQERFLEGLDDIGITMRHVDAITAYEKTRPAWLPTVNAPAAS